MKLYLEEQVKQAYIDGMSFIAVDPTKYEQDAEEYVREMHPIILPSDEEIQMEINCDVHIESDTDFFNGAIWMRDKLTNTKEK